MKQPKPLLEAVRYFADERAAWLCVVNRRWPDSAISCPRCGSPKVRLIESRMAGRTSSQSERGMRRKIMQSTPHLIANRRRRLHGRRPISLHWLGYLVVALAALFIGSVWGNNQAEHRESLKRVVPVLKSAPKPKHDKWMLPDQFGEYSAAWVAKDN